MKNLYVNELDGKMFNQVKELVMNALIELGFEDYELDEMLQDALDSKLEDLNDLIDLSELN